MFVGIVILITMSLAIYWPKNGQQWCQTVCYMQNQSCD